MVKETTIKVSNEFKESLRGKKLNGEDFEQTLIRLIKRGSILQKQEKGGILQAKDIEYTEQEQEWEDIPTETTDAYGKKIIIKKGRRIGEEATIKILSSLPTSIQKAFYEKEQEQNNPFLNPPKEEPNFEIKILPGKTPLEILEHQEVYKKWK